MLHMNKMTVPFWLAHPPFLPSGHLPAFQVVVRRGWTHVGEAVEVSRCPQHPLCPAWLTWGCSSEKEDSETQTQRHADAALCQFPVWDMASLTAPVSVAWHPFPEAANAILPKAKRLEKEESGIGGRGRRLQWLLQVLKCDTEEEANQRGQWWTEMGNLEGDLMYQ